MNIGEKNKLKKDISQVLTRKGTVEEIIEIVGVEMDRKDKVADMTKDKVDNLEKESELEFKVFEIRVKEVSGVYNEVIKLLLEFINTKIEQEQDRKTKEVLYKIFYNCINEDSKALELVEEELDKLKN